MRPFKCRPFKNHSVDLDDPKTYNYLSKDIKELRQKMFAEIGYAFCYMNFWHKDVFCVTDSFGFRDGGQKERVESLVKKFTEKESENRDNVLWYQEQIFIFQDEIENMC